MIEMAIGKSMNDKKTCYSCDVRASDIAGRGTFATRDIGAGEELFREASFLVSRKVSRRRLDCSIPHSPTPADDAPTEVSSALRKQICVSLSAISIQHKHCPPSVRLVPTDTGGTLSGSEDTYWFARAYAASSSATRAAVLELDTFGGSESHAVFEVVRAESHVLRQLDPNLLSIPTNELECAIQRYWANTFGLEGGLHRRGSRFNHSCSPNCTRVLLPAGAQRSFVTLKPVPAGEELTLSYLPSEMEAMGTAVRRRHLWLSRGFLCRCERCLQPQDDLRQVGCPDCAASLPPRTRRRGSVRNSKRARRVAGGEEGPPPPPEEAEFADWWNQSGVWVCRRCGWCSDRSGRLHHAEGVLSAEVFSRVMADAVFTPWPRLPPRPPPPRPRPPASPARSGKEALEAIYFDRSLSRPAEAAAAEAAAAEAAAAAATVTEAEEERRQAERNAMQEMLDASLALVGGRHWASFSCARMRLAQELYFLLREDSEGEEEKKGGGGDEVEEKGGKQEEEEEEGGEERGSSEEKKEGGEGKRAEQDSTLSSALPSSSPASISSQSGTTTTPPPPLPPPPPPPPRSSPGMSWALRAMSSLWRWLSERLSVTNHPPAYYLFDVICDILDVYGPEIAEAERAEVAGRAGRDAQGLRLVLTSVEAWVSVYGDEQQRLRFGAAVGAAAGRRSSPLTHR